jgi:hypothetical protein
LSVRHVGSASVTYERRRIRARWYALPRVASTPQQEACRGGPNGSLPVPTGVLRKCWRGLAPPLLAARMGMQRKSVGGMLKNWAAVLLIR